MLPNVIKNLSYPFWKHLLAHKVVINLNKLDISSGDDQYISYFTSLFQNTKF